MMFAPCLGFTLQWEAGYVDNPADTGGPTNMGITLATLSAWRHEDCSTDDVRQLTRIEATAIYGANFWNAVRGPDLPAGVDLMIFDHAVLAGVARSAMLLQGAAGVAMDGHIGPQTMLALKALSAPFLIQALSAAQTGFYRTRPTFPTFGHGWLNRVNARTSSALAMVRAHG